MSVSWPLNDGDRFPSSGPLAAADTMSWDNQEIDDLIAEVTVDAYGDDEQLSSFEYAFEELDVLPDATVIGEVVEVLSGHLCRCTGYAGIVAAVLEAAGGGVTPAGDNT